MCVCVCMCVCAHSHTRALASVCVYAFWVCAEGITTYKDANNVNCLHAYMCVNTVCTHARALRVSIHLVYTHTPSVHRYVHCTHHTYIRYIGKCYVCLCIHVKCVVTYSNCVYTYAHLTRKQHSRCIVLCVHAASSGRMEQHSLWQFPLRLLHPPNPPNRETWIPRYVMVQIQVEILV